jgi:phage gp29-like protein
MRSILFWWLLSTMSREWWARFLDRYGHPFLVGSYPRGDRDAKSVLERAFALSVRLGGLVVSDGTRVELKEASTTATGDAYERFISLCNREKSKLVIGQTLSAEAAPTGLGSGVSQQQELVRQDIRAFDAQLLAESLRDQLFDQIAAINGAAGMLPKQSFGRDIALTADRTTKTLTALRSTDFEPDDSATPPLSAALGITLRRRAVSAVPSPFSAYVARLERGV